MHDQIFVLLFKKCLDKTKIYQREMGHTYTEIQLYCKEDTAIFISHFRILSSFFLRAIFGAYSFSLFGFSVIYFLSRIVGYKLGFVQSSTYRKYLPRRRGSGKSYLRGIRYKKNRHRKKRCIKKKRATRSPFVESFSSAFTTVLNVDKHVSTKDLLPYDTDSTTMVYDNSANVHICNK